VELLRRVPCPGCSLEPPHAIGSKSSVDSALHTCPGLKSKPQNGKPTSTQNSHNCNCIRSHINICSRAPQLMVAHCWRLNLEPNIKWMKLSRTMLSFRGKLGVQPVNLTRPSQSILNPNLHTKGCLPKNPSFPSIVTVTPSHVDNLELSYDETRSCVSASVGIRSQNVAMYSKRNALLGSTWPELSDTTKVCNIYNGFLKNTGFTK
jgi:hypothetical protein